MDTVSSAEGPDDGRADGFGEAVTPTDLHPARPGDEVFEPEVARLPEPLVGKDEASPLEEDETDHVVPPGPLLAMKDRRHVQWHLLPAELRHQRLRAAVGSGDEELYFVDDGAHHVMIGRRVGARAGECEYCLVARAPRQRYDDLRNHAVRPADAFSDAEEITLCGVATAKSVLSTNVFDVTRYASPADIPARYLPGAPFIEFDEDLDITVD